ncbi:MAG: PQQ-binding-like beta-propeller repeat protein, partial [Planctomycetaceae bacterium]
TGKTAWTAKTSARHGSPVVAHIAGTPVVVTPGGAIVRVVDGTIIAKNQFQLNHSSPVVHDGVVYATQDGSIKAVTLADASAEQAVTQVVWETTGSRSSRLASPICHEGSLYSVTEKGILEVTDAKTGQRIYRKRLEFDGGRVDPSITMAGNRLYVSNTRGATVVFHPGKDYQEIARSQLNDRFSSSLAFAGRQLYIRTRKFLYCIEQATPRTAGGNPSQR